MSVGAILLIASPVILTQAGFVLSEYGGESLLESLTGKELNQLIGKEQREILKEFLGNNENGVLNQIVKFRIPEGLTRETLEIYKVIIKKAVEAGIDTRNVQQLREIIINQALRVLPK